MLQSEVTTSANNKVINRNCILCGSDKKAPRYPAKLPALHSSKNVLHYQYEDTSTSNDWHYEVVRCKDCGHQFAGAIYDQKTVEDSYLLQEHDNAFGLDDRFLFRTNDGYARLVEPFLPKQGRDLQVDVGCDIGTFLQVTKRLGYKRIVGIEPGVDSARRAAEISGVEVFQKIFEAKDFAPESINFMSLIHVLDHLVDARQMLQDVYPSIAKGGIVFAVVHNIESLIAKISGESWAPLNLVHFEYFTPATLAKLFEKQGFKVLAVRGTKNYFPFSHLIRFAPFLPSKIRGPLVNLASSRLLRNAGIGLKLGNIAVIAEKK